MDNTNNTLPILVSDKDGDLPEIQQKEGKFLWIKYKKGLTDKDISSFASDITNFAVKEITCIKKQLSVLHKMDSEISSLLCEVLETSQEAYKDLASRSTFLEEVLRKIEGNSESVSRICKQLKTIIRIYREEQIDNVFCFEEIKKQINNIEKQLQDTCVSYDVFKSLESRVRNLEETINRLKDKVSKLQQNCVSHEDLKNLDSIVKNVEEKLNIKIVEGVVQLQSYIDRNDKTLHVYREELNMLNEKAASVLNLKEDIAQLHNNNEALLEQVKNLEKEVSVKSFFDTIWYKVSVGVMALAALGISIFSIL